jgi:hypothetical protein
MAESPTRSIVGGVFGLELSEHPTQPPFLDERAICFINARSALHCLLRDLAPRTLWIPSYLCDVIIAAARGICPLEFYDVGSDLRAGQGRWIESLNQDDIVLVIDYFGFRRWLPIAAAIHDRGARIIEDAAQALFLPRAQEADFIIYSPRKFLGVADGGILQSKVRFASSIVRSEPPPQWWFKAYAARLLRAEYDRGATSRRWFELFQESEREAPIGSYCISDVSMAQLRYGIDYNGVQRERVTNYNILASALSGCALYTDLDDDVVPLGFPVRVPDRDRVCEALYREGLYPPVHWPIRGVVPEQFQESHRLAGEILTIPCDQRYDAGAMMRAALIVRGVL